MAEAYVKTFKRDYVYLNDLPYVITVINALPKWIDDYNYNCPLGSVNMGSRHEFLAIKLANCPFLRRLIQNEDLTYGIA